MTNKNIIFYLGVFVLVASLIFIMAGILVARGDVAKDLQNPKTVGLSLLYFGCASLALLTLTAGVTSLRVIQRGY